MWTIINTIIFLVAVCILAYAWYSASHAGHGENGAFIAFFFGLFLIALSAISAVIKFAGNFFGWY